MGTANILACECLEDRFSLATLLVNTVADNTLQDGKVSLREAILAANTNSIVGDAIAGDVGHDIIEFAPVMLGNTIVLSLGQFIVTEDLTINVTAPSQLTIDANGLSRHFRFDDNTSTIIGLSLLNGWSDANGGSILSKSSDLTVERVQFDSCFASGNGGAVCVINSNETAIRDSAFIGNRATRGGGVFTKFTQAVLIEGVQFDSNVAKQDGGGFYVVDSQLNVTNTMLVHNLALRGGGGLTLRSPSYLIDSSFDQNTTQRIGGGLAAIHSNTEIQNSSFLDNYTGLVLGAVAGDGGALHAQGNSNVQIRESTIRGNVSGRNGGGIYVLNGSAVDIRNSFVRDNVAQGSNLGNGGGGVFVNNATLRLFDSILDSNRAIGDAGSGGGVFSYRSYVGDESSTVIANQARLFGGGFQLLSSTARLESTLVEYNLVGSSSHLGHGGGIYFANSDATLSTLGVEGNRSYGQGGGLFVSQSSSVVFGGNRLMANTAQLEGGGAFVAGSLVFSWADIRFNVSAISGGAIYREPGAHVDLGTAYLSDNLPDDTNF